MANIVLKKAFLSEFLRKRPFLVQGNPCKRTDEKESDRGNRGSYPFEQPLLKGKCKGK